MSKHYVRFVGLVTVILISVLDYFIVVDISLSILYLLPITFTSWYGTRWFSILLVLTSAIAWFVAESSAKGDLNFAILLWNTTVRLIVFLIVAHLLSSLKLAYEQEKTLSQTDGLTKIVNRRFFLEILAIEYERSLRYDCCFTLAYLDLDNFKQINDRFGHQTGDDLLKLVAQTLHKNIREIDTVARLGGDEFALLLPETNYQNGKIALNRLQQQLMNAIEAYSPIVSTSIGAITFLNAPDSIDKMLESVDNLMYKVKKRGKNGIEHQQLPSVES